MKRLLDKPFRAFTIYSFVILLISIPTYFYVVDYIWLEELDEQNYLTTQHTKTKLQSLELDSADLLKIENIWGTLQPGITISNCENIANPKDSIYEAIRPNEYDLDNGVDRFRGLRTTTILNGKTYCITSETNVEESDETFMAISFVTLIFMALLILGFILLNRFISARTWKPFYITLDALKSFDISKDKSIILSDSDIYEFKELNDSINLLIQGNISSYQQQKSFTENASHELQTPIALLRSKLGLLLQEKGLTPQISSIINGLDGPLSRLSRINKNLLLLAKVEYEHFFQSENIRVDKSISNIIEQFIDYAHNKQIVITPSLKGADMIVANSYLFDTIISNLLSNAIRNSRKGTIISIISSPGYISFSNEGEQSLNGDQLFKRFSKYGDGAADSTGLGLSIIKEITNKYGWSVKYCFLDNQHTFRVDY